MPHLVIDRLRNFNVVLPSTWVVPDLPSKRRDLYCAYFVEVLDIFAGVIFVAGSFCFLPEYSGEHVAVFLVGCALYIVGAVIYLLLSVFTLAEAYRQAEVDCLEVWENILYVVGSLIFLVGTILYWPPEAHRVCAQYSMHPECTVHMDRLVQHMSLGVYFNLFSPEFEGTILFIVGSFVFAFAAFVNGLQKHHSFDSASSRMLTATTSLYMGGSLLFVTGSVAFMPDFGCNDGMVELGAWCFIVGSLLYVIGGCVSFVRVGRELGNPENQSLRPAQ